MSATFFDKILLIPALCAILGKTLAAAVTGAVLGIRPAPTYFSHVQNSALRAFLGHLSTRQFQYIIPPFVESYKTWCDKQGFKADIVQVKPSNGAPEVTGFWIGDKATAKYAMVYFHGGGFVLPGSPDHLALLAKFVKWSQNNLAIFCVAYTLAPNARYPFAISQGVEGLRYILDTKKGQEPRWSPANVLLGGDSAGAAQALAVLSHISAHPHPRSDIVKPLQVDGKLFGAVLVAPWISGADAESYPSLKTYATRDIFSVDTAKYWLTAYKGDAPQDEYICAAQAPMSWWDGAKCGKILATTGEHEALVDSVVDWRNKYQQANGQESVELAIGRQETHIAPIVAPTAEDELRKEDNRSQERALMLWIQENLSYSVMSA